jgi:hypothetical protein
MRPNAQNPGSSRPGFAFDPLESVALSLVGRTFAASGLLFGLGAGAGSESSLAGDVSSSPAIARFNALDVGGGARCAGAGESGVGLCAGDSDG